MMVYVHFGLSRSVNICISLSEAKSPASILKVTVTGEFGVKDPEGSIDIEPTENADTA
jgi:hypothetical protein